MTFAVYVNPSFIAINPSLGCNDNSSLPVIISGDNFFGNPSIKLKKAGEPDIPALGTVISGSTQINCTFDLSGSFPGEWDLEIVNPDGRSVMKPGAFTITDPPVIPLPALESVPTVTSTVISGNSGSSEGRNHHTGVGASQNIGAGETVSYMFNKGAVYKVSVTAATNIKKLMITVRSLNSVPYGMKAPDMDIYEYEDVKIYYAENSDISSEKFYFTVSKNRLSSMGYSKEDVAMMYFNGETWGILPTLFTGEDSNYYYYSSETSMLSFFAIGISEDATIIPEEEISPSDTITPYQTQIPETTVISTPGIKVTDLSEEPDSFGFPVPGVVFASLILTGIIGAGAWSRRRKARYPDWWFEDRK